MPAIVQDLPHACVEEEEVGVVGPQGASQSVEVDVHVVLAVDEVHPTVR